MLKNKKFILTVIIAALFLKVCLFLYESIFIPQAKFLPDSGDYLRTAQALASRGAFAQDNNGVLTYELLRTPGYPVFLSLLHYVMKIPLEGVIFLQLLLTLLVARLTYKTASRINSKTAFLSAAIVLYSLPITVSSLQILTDTLYLFLISLFMFVFIRYLENGKVKLVVLSAILIVFATYVRPISYYFGYAAAIFIIYANRRNKFLRVIFHVLIFLAIVYSLLGLWQLRNYWHFNRYIFTSIQNDYKALPIFKSYASDSGLFSKNVHPVFNYINAAWHCFLSLTTKPGSLKYFHCYALTAVGKVFGYSFVIFWWIGFLAGLTKLKNNIYYQFLLLIILYFVFVTIVIVAKSSSERYLVPVIPLIALISAAGWVRLRDIYIGYRDARKRRNRNID